MKRLLYALICFAVLKVGAIVFGRCVIYKQLSSIDSEAKIIMGNSHGQCAFLPNKNLLVYCESAMTIDIGIEKVRLLRKTGFTGEVIFLVDRKTLSIVAQDRWNNRLSKKTRLAYFKTLNQSSWFSNISGAVVREAVYFLVKPNYLGGSFTYDGSTKDLPQQRFEDIKYSGKIKDKLNILKELKVRFMWAPGQLDVVIDEDATGKLFEIDPVKLDVELNEKDYFDFEHLNSSGQKKWMKAFNDEIK